MKVTDYDDGEINLQMENGETLTITGKDVVELIELSTAFTNFIQTNSIGKKEDILAKCD